MILCIGTTPAAQRVMVFKRLALDQVNRAEMTLDGIAGKSINVAKVLKALGESPIATGFLGGPQGDEIARVLKDKQIEANFVNVSTPTRQCITVVDQADGTITELVEESRRVAAAEVEKLFEIVRRQVKRCRAVIMSGTLVPGAPVEFYADSLRLAREAGAMGVVDAQGAALLEALKAKPGLVKPNRQELARTLQREISTDEELIDAMRALHKQGAERVVVTSGKDAAWAFDGKSTWRIKPPRINPLNPIGSGDSFTAALTLALLRGEDLGRAAAFGAAAGAANALSWMAGELNAVDVSRLLLQTGIERL